VDDSVTETVYMASVCELFYSIGANESGINLRFHGFDEKLETLIVIVMELFLEVSERASHMWKTRNY
tara:strand:+ start:362 stop:562 length:201 start_codon:yes stop_codon:yes gene_type:complete